MTIFNSYVCLPEGNNLGCPKHDAGYDGQYGADPFGRGISGW